ncbi:MAG TPA: amino acid adenylation domain-containing protein [Actinomycetota bacterium]|nr:amino acid adenylation domain-containing protein [Actinomycetota bacterium]
MTDPTASETQPSADNAHLFPASFGQERLWFLEQLLPDAPLYTHHEAWRLRGPLDGDALTCALNDLVRRHETLRTAYSRKGGELLQVVHPEVEVRVEIEDVSAAPEEEREELARGEVLAWAAEHFDLSVAPLMRAVLVRISHDDAVLVLVMHHTVVDGWSVGVIVDELSELYAARLEARDLVLPELPVQYADYAVWQREWLQGAELDEQMAYWRDKLAGAPAVLDLPVDRPRRPAPSFEAARVQFAVPPEVAARLDELGKAAGVTPFMLYLAAFVVLLSRYASRTDVVVGTPVAGRNRTEVERLIGFFVNTLVLRTDLFGNPSFTDLLGRVREVCLDAFAHQDLPFEKLVEQLHPERDLSHNPLFQVAFALQPSTPSVPRMPGLSGEQFPVGAAAAAFDLTLEMREGNGTFTYATDLFDAATIERMSRHYLHLLRSIAGNPSASLSRVEILPDDERCRLLEGFNDTALEVPGVLMHDLIRQTALRHRDRIALRFGGRDMTYGEMESRVERLTARLCAMGVGAEICVGFCLPRGFDMICALLGIMRSGGAFVPLDPSSPEARLRFMLDDTRASVVVTESSLVHLLPRTEASVVLVDADFPDDPAPAPPALHPDNLAYVVYTSGSTGTPKGTAVQHGGITSMMLSLLEPYGIREGSRVLQFHSVAFDAWLSEVFTTLYAGGTLVLGERADLLPGPGLGDLLNRERVDVALLAPSAVAVMQDNPLPHLETMIVCGEACPPELVSRWGRDRRFVNAYGPTEVTVCTHVAVCEDDGRPPPIGHTNANLSSYILDPWLNPAPERVPGELHIGGLGVSRGYLNRPGLTAERFLPDPFGPPGSRMYRTGDLARFRSDGQVEFLGRLDHQVKVRGFRIEPGEVEAALASHPAVRECVVVVRGEAADKRLAAYAAVGDAASSVADLRAYLSERLPPYMVPELFVLLDSLPHNSSGKIDRAALPKPGPVRASMGGTVLPPRTPSEREVAEAWKAVLRLDEVGVTDKFFDVGGNSLRLVDLHEQLERRFPGCTSVAQLFEHVTIRDQAAHVDRRVGEPRPVATAAFEL